MLSKDVDGDWVRFAYMIHPDGTIHRPTELATDLNGPRHDLDPFEPGSVFHRSVDVCSPAQAANWMTYGHRKEQIRSLEPRSFEWPTDPRELSAQKEYYRKFRPTFPPWYTELLSDCTANAEHLLKLGSGEELSEEARVASAGAQRLKLLVSVPTSTFEGLMMDCEGAELTCPCSELGLAPRDDPRCRRGHVPRRRPVRAFLGRRDDLERRCVPSFTRAEVSLS